MKLWFPYSSTTARRIVAMISLSLAFQGCGKTAVPIAPSAVDQLPGAVSPVSNPAAFVTASRAVNTFPLVNGSFTLTLGASDGSVGTVIHFGGVKKLPTVRFANGLEIEIEDQTWEIKSDGKVLASRTQLPLRLAWAARKSSHFLPSGRRPPSFCFAGEGTDKAQPAGVPVAIKSPANRS